MAAPVQVRGDGWCISVHWCVNAPIVLSTPSLFPSSDPCYGVKCPDVSKCTVQNGAAVCKCPAPFKRLINNQCSAAALAHSDYLDQHNAVRAAVGAVPLVWDDVLATRARAWAITLTTREHNCRLQHGGTSDEGQNLSSANPSGWVSNDEAVRWWVDKAKWYQLDVFPNGCADGAKCGHYTQVARVGCVACGMVACGMVACGMVACGMVACGMVACGMVACGMVACGMVACGMVAYPCRGASRCAGDLVCDGSSGAAQCVCPQGTVLTAPNICLGEFWSRGREFQGA
ncbi:unnamed protein product [Closterium sp. Naga37s-1]|nr:unnamed protein product [Closterium sp. Naga37s-1]